VKKEIRVKATAYGHSFAALVPRRIVPDHQRDEVLEVSIMRAESRVGYQLYTRHLPGYKRAYLDLYQIKPQKQEEFVIKSVRLYDVQMFFSDYNTVKPLGLENTSLLIEGGEPTFEADGLKVPLLEVSMRTYQGIAVIDCMIESLGNVKIQKTVGAFEVRLGDHSSISSIHAGERGLLLAYRRTLHDHHPHLRIAKD